MAKTAYHGMGKMGASAPRKGGKGASRVYKLKKNVQTNLLDITNPAIKRLARRAGVKRLRKSVYDTSRGKLGKFLDELMYDTIVFTKMDDRSTMTQTDVVNALAAKGKTMLV